MNVAKKDEGFTSFADIKMNISSEELAIKEKDFLKGADMITKSKIKSKSGRKKKEIKAEVSKVVYFTDEQSKTVDTYCNGATIPFSTLVKQLLHEKGILN